MKAQALLVYGVDQIKISDVEIPSPGPGEVLVEAEYTAVSPGTELRVLKDASPGMGWPFIPGYSLAGTIVSAGPQTSLAVGTRVFCSGTRAASCATHWGGHVSHALAQEDSVYPIADHIDLRDACLISLLSIAYRGVRLCSGKPHEKVAVIGLGPIGQISARLHQLTGAHVVAADICPWRVDLAAKAGVQSLLVSGSISDAFAKVFPAGANMVVDSTGVPAVLKEAIKVAADKPWDDTQNPGARVVVQGSYPGDVALPYQDAFMKELSFWLPRNYQPTDAHAVIDLLSRGKLKVRDLIGDILNPKDAPAAYQDLRQQKNNWITIAFKWKAS